MGKITIVCLVVLVAISLTQGSPANQEPKNVRLINLLKKALSKLEKKQAPCDTPSTKVPEEAFKDLDTLEDLFTMPNSEFLQDAALRRMLLPIPPVEALREFTFDPEIMGPIETMVYNVEPFITTPSTFATAVTMEMIPVLLDGRMFCPSTVLNQFMMRLWDYEYQYFVNSDNEAYGQFSDTAIAVFPILGEMPEELDLFVKAALETMHSTLFNETYTLVLAQELKDVANVTHILYNKFFALKATPEDPTVATPFINKVENSLQEADVRCRSGFELARHNRLARSIFMNDLEDIETYDVCKFIGEFSYSYFARRVRQMPDVDIEQFGNNAVWENLHDLCKWVKDFIHEDVFSSFLYYQDILDKQRTDDLLLNCDFLEPFELDVLKEVLVRLGWPAPGSTSTNTAARLAFTNRDVLEFLGRSSGDFQDFLERSSGVEKASENLQDFIERSSGVEKASENLQDFIERSSGYSEGAREREWSRPSQRGRDRSLKKVHRGFGYNPIYPLA